MSVNSTSVAATFITVAVIAVIVYLVVQYVIPYYDKKTSPLEKMSITPYSGDSLIRTSRGNPVATLSSAKLSGQYNVAAPSDISRGITAIPQGYNPVGLNTGILAPSMNPYNGKSTANRSIVSSSLMPSGFTSNKELTPEQLASGFTTEARHASQVRASGNIRSRQSGSNAMSRRLGMPNLLRPAPPVVVNAYSEPQFNDSEFRQDIVHQVKKQMGIPQNVSSTACF